jgi:hypothetical protein
MVPPLIHLYLIQTYYDKLGLSRTARDCHHKATALTSKQPSGPTKSPIYVVVCKANLL